MTTDSANITTKVQEAFPFSVDKFSLSGPDNMKTPFYGLFRSDNSASVGKSVSKIYVPHQSEDVITLVEAVSEAFESSVDLKCYFKEGHYVTIQPTKEQHKLIFDQDAVWPRIIISAGYDGKAFKATMGYYRDVCRNMARIKDVRSTEVSIRHTSGLRSHMDELIRDFQSLKQSWTDLSAVMDQMSAKRVNMVEFMKAVYGEPSKEGRETTIHQNRTESIFRRLTSERYALGLGAIPGDFQISAWEAFNAVQAFSQHDSIARKGINEMDRILRSMNDSNVLRAEHLALSM
jgi:Domain of unknown function (DUF932)